MIGDNKGTPGAAGSFSYRGKCTALKKPSED